MRLSRCWSLGLVMAFTAVAAAGGPRVLDLTSSQRIDDIAETLAERRVVFVGETHDRYDHHRNQLDVIRAMHERHPSVAIGVEFFQQPFQAALDAYISGDIGLVELLKRTEYFDRWGLNFRNYAPILEFAREHEIPVVALNVRTELVRKVRQKGLDALSGDDRRALPAEIDRGNDAYRERLKNVFEHHAAQGHAADFDYFYQAQLVWDEAMAAEAAAYIDTHPSQKMVILAGNGHIAYGDGIPDRLHRRTAVSSALILNAWEGPIEPGLADYLLVSQARTLGQPGRLGVYLESADEGVTITRFSADSHAPAAGLEPGDRIVAVEGRAVESVGDIKAVLWAHQPGELAAVEVVREGAGGRVSRTVEVTLE